MAGGAGGRQGLAVCQQRCQGSRSGGWWSLRGRCVAGVAFCSLSLLHNGEKWHGTKTGPNTSFPAVVIFYFFPMFTDVLLGHFWSFCLWSKANSWVQWNRYFKQLAFFLCQVRCYMNKTPFPEDAFQHPFWLHVDDGPQEHSQGLQIQAPWRMTQLPSCVCFYAAGRPVHPHPKAPVQPPSFCLWKENASLGTGQRLQCVPQVACSVCTQGIRSCAGWVQPNS